MIFSEVSMDTEVVGSEGNHQLWITHHLFAILVTVIGYLFDICNDRIWDV